MNPANDAGTVGAGFIRERALAIAKGFADESCSHKTPRRRRYFFSSAAQAVL